MNDLRRLAESGEETNIEHAFGILNSFRLLGAMRSGKRGVEALNAAMMKLLGHHGLHSPGVPLLVTRNDPRTELYNGDIGLVVADPSAPGAVRVRFPNRARSFIPAELPEHKAVYAMTVHKSQGSEYRAVVLALAQAAPRLLTRGVLYTAVTRSRELLIAVGEEETAYRMIDNHVQSRRYSGLRIRLSSEI